MIIRCFKWIVEKLKKRFSRGTGKSENRPGLFYAVGNSSFTGCPPTPNCTSKHRVINLQLFAEGDKTEKATPKKRQEARKRGQVLQSREISSAIVLIFTFFGLKLFGGYIYGEIASYIKRTIVEYSKVEDIASQNFLPNMFIDAITVLLKTTAPIFGLAILSGLFVSYAQVGFLFTLETLGVKFSRINPINGFKRIFSMHGIVELVKSIIKIVVIGAVTYFYLKGEESSILNLIDLDVMNVAVYISATSINIAVRICVVLIILGILDYGYQWWEYEKSLKMTKHDVKEEYKQTEGNPEIKGKIKQRQRQISMRRMLHEVPKADVVITNPTHYAVAVKYDPDVSDAPRVVAKGQDFIALRIKDVAKENEIQIVENKPLARSLYESVDVGQGIPPELYQAVAEVIAFVYSLKGKGRAG